MGAEAIVTVVATPFGHHIDPIAEGREVVNGFADRIWAEQIRRIVLANLLKPFVFSNFRPLAINLR